MVKALSNDLRDRVVVAVNEGTSKRSVAKRFRVAPSTVVKLMQRWKEAGTLAPRARGGDRRSQAVEKHAAAIIALVEKQADITLEEIADDIKKRQGERFAPSVIWRLLDRRGLTFKKNRTRQ